MSILEPIAGTVPPCPPLSNGPDLLCNGSIGMGSIGSWEPINLSKVGSTMHQFWKERTKLYPPFGSKQGRKSGWEFEILNSHLGTHQFEFLRESL